MKTVLLTFSDRLQRSFSAIYAALEVPRTARWVIAVLLLIHTGLLAYSAYVHSPTLNEPAHLVAGLSHWKFGRFEFYRVNPPLVRMVAALPVMAVGCQLQHRHQRASALCSLLFSSGSAKSRGEFDQRSK